MYKPESRPRPRARPRDAPRGRNQTPGLGSSCPIVGVHTRDGLHGKGPRALCSVCVSMTVKLVPDIEYFLDVALQDDFCLAKSRKENLRNRRRLEDTAYRVHVFPMACVLLSSVRFCLQLKSKPFTGFHCENVFSRRKWNKIKGHLHTVSSC